ncbi:MAG: AlpA family phage regulatory protein [Hyphomonadaceae bacterium]
MTALARYIRPIDLEVSHGIPRSTQYHYLKTDPTFPRPFKISPRCVRFKVDEVEAWIASRRNTAPAV